MRVLISWLMMTGGAVATLTAMLYLPAAMSVDDISGVPLSILIMISIVGIVLVALGLALLRRRGATVAAGT